MARTIGERRVDAARVSVISNTALTLSKLVVGLLTGSISVISEALHSGLDLLAAILAYFGVSKAAQPADDRHRFGHGKYESLASLIEGLLILAASAVIVYAAVRRLLAPEHIIVLPLLGAAIMLVSMVVNIAVSSLLFRVARETESLALEADGWHLRTDVYTSAAVLVGLGLVWAGYRVGWDWIDHADPLVAIGVAAYIVRAAIGIMTRSSAHLLDRALPLEEEEQIRRLLAEHYPQLSGYHELRTRRAGAQRHIDLHLELPPEMPVAEAHALCDHLERDINAVIPRAEVLIHVEPASRAPTRKK